MAGVPIFFLLLAAPLAFLSGLKETYIPSSWTSAYRELQALGSLDLEFEAGGGLARAGGYVPEIIPPNQPYAMRLAEMVRSFLVASGNLFRYIEYGFEEFSV